MKRREFFLAPAVAAAQTSIKSVRPHLYFTVPDAARLRARLDRDPALKQAWTKFLESAARLLDATLVPESEALKGGGQHGNYSPPSAQISAMGLTLGLAWHVTADRHYAVKLREALLHYSSYSRWNAPGQANRDPQWKSELNGGRFCYGMATGYDALHAFLAPDERKQVAQAIARLGVLPVLEDWVLPETRIHALDSMGHNWWAVCVSMAGVAALSIHGDDDRVPQWLDRITRGLALWFDFSGSLLQNKTANFDRAGAFYEGVGYANYALSEYLRFRLAYANLFPDRPQPRFRALAQSADFFLKTLYPTKGSYYTLNFGDSGLHVNAAPTMRLLLETGFGHPNAGWYLDRVSALPSREALDPLQFVLRKSTTVVPPDHLPRSVAYRDIGWAVLRSSWKDDATLLAVRSGFTWNHVHADAGSFVLFHAGQPLITDSGACSYSNSLYVRYYVQSRAHNVVLYNGEGQPAEDIRRGIHNPGSVHSLIDGVGVQYVCADATGPMSHRLSRNFRHWLWIGGVILVLDDVRAHQEGRLDWLLHYDGEARVDGSRVSLANGGARAELRFLFPAQLAHREEMGYADHRPDRQVPYLVFATPSPVREEKFLAAIVPAGAAPPQVEPLTAPLAIGARIRHGGQITDVWMNLQADGRRMHDNSNHTIEGWQTDAYLLAITRDSEAAEPARVFVANGSYVRKDGRVVLDSLSKLTAAWRPGPKAEILLDGQRDIEAAIAVEGRPSALTVNGRDTRFTHDAKSRLLSFRASL
jgi:hypothetical protein